MAMIPIELTDKTKMSDADLLKLLEYKVLTWEMHYEKFCGVLPELEEIFRELIYRANKIITLNYNGHQHTPTEHKRADFGSNSGAGYGPGNGAANG